MVCEEHKTMGKDKAMLMQKNSPEGEEQSQGPQSSHLCGNAAEGGRSFGYGWIIRNATQWRADMAET